MAKAITRSIRNEQQKELVKLFDKLCYRHARWEVWSDFVAASAISISCSVDLVHKEKRQKDFLDIKKRYTEDEFRLFSEMFALVVIGMEGDPDQDFLGELFMVLGLGNDSGGQFFTPYNLCRMMAQMNGGVIDKIADRGWASVNDPACGAGATLVGFANYCKSIDVNYQQTVLFCAQDIDYTTALMCYIQLSLLGCAGYVTVGNTLAHPQTCLDSDGLIPRDEGNVWYMPMYYSEIWTGRKMVARLKMMERDKHDRC